MYDVMATPVRAAPAARAGIESDWSPARHRMISGEEVVELLPALATREPTAAISSTTARPTTCGWC